MTKCRVHIHEGPLPPAMPWQVPGAGATIVFEGIVRPREAEQPIDGLRYETYDPMAEKELERLAGQALTEFDILAMDVQHSRGLVPHDACSFRLRIASAHRQQGLAAMSWYIDQMKQIVPIWKRPVFSACRQEALP